MCSMGACAISTSNCNFKRWWWWFVVFTAIGGKIVDVDVIVSIAIPIKIRVIEIMGTGTFLNELLDLMSMVNLCFFDPFTGRLLLLNEL